MHTDQKSECSLLGELIFKAQILDRSIEIRIKNIQVCGNPDQTLNNQHAAALWLNPLAVNKHANHVEVAFYLRCEKEH